MEKSSQIKGPKVWFGGYVDVSPSVPFGPVREAEDLRACTVETPARKPQSDEPPPSPWGPERQHKHRDPIVWLKGRRQGGFQTSCFVGSCTVGSLCHVVSWAPTPNREVEGFRLESRAIATARSSTRKIQHPRFGSWSLKRFSVPNKTHG